MYRFVSDHSLPLFGGCCLLLLLPFLCCRAADDDLIVRSPDGKLALEVESESGHLFYQVRRQVRREDRVLIQRSAFSILGGGEPVTVMGTQRRTIDRSWEPVWGQKSSVRDHARELVIPMRAGSLDFELQLRAYDEGVGFRFSFPEQAGLRDRKLNFRVEYRFNSDYSLYHPKGEAEPVGPIPLSDFEPNRRGASIPAVIELERDLLVAILESDLYSAVTRAEIDTMLLSRLDGEQPGLLSVNECTVHADSYDTPWRVILTARQPGELMINDVPLNLAAECQIEDPSWIRTGKAAWDWRVRGYQVGDFRYDADTASIRRFLDFAAENNIQYFLLDWMWYHVRDGAFVVAPAIDIEEVMAHAREKGVAVMLYWDGKHGGRLLRLEEVYTTFKRWDERPDGNLPMEEVYQLYSGFGASGIKFGFRGNNAAFTAEAIRKAAEHRLVIDFHDFPTPMVGVHRTYPNAVTREYNHAQMDARRASGPREFLKTVMINGITGPLDMNNGFYALATVPGQTSRIGWSRTPVLSTVASENARVLVCPSGLMVLPDAPEEYRKKADLFEFIARIPGADWDETVVLRSELARHISVARRKGREWFVGTVVDGAGGSLELELDFLDPGVSYAVTYYEDAEDTHFETNPESYRVRTGAVRQGEVVTAVMAPGGGHSMWIRPAR